MNVKVNRINLVSEGNVKAFVDLIIEGWFVVKGVKVMDSQKGLFVAMPSKKGSDGKYYDTANPISAEGRAEIDRVVMEAYNDAASK